MNIIVLGPPGVGKGTQAKRLETRLNLPHIASGDIFRAIRGEDSPLARQVREYMDSGAYVPDALTIELVLNRLRRPDTSGGFILDGFPRTIGQAEALDRSLPAMGVTIDRVLNITAPAAVLQQRLRGRIICPQCHAIYNLESKPPKQNMVCDVCGHGLERRTDESPDVVRTRIEVYGRETRPLVEYYGQRDLVVEVNGARSINAVDGDVDAALGMEGVR
jgi:adenylate kinase